MKILSGRTEISIFEVSCSSTGCKSSAELMLFWVLSGYISSSGTLHFSHLSISSSAELWEFSAESSASSFKKAKLQMDVWSKIPSFFFFSFKKNIWLLRMSAAYSLCFSQRKWNYSSQSPMDKGRYLKWFLCWVWELFISQGSEMIPRQENLLLTWAYF